MSSISDISSAASDLLNWAGTSANMDQIDFDVTVRWNGPTTKFTYEYKESENEILIRSKNRWGRLKENTLPAPSNGITLTDEEYEALQTEGEVELTGMTDDWISQVKSSGSKEILVIKEDGTSTSYPIWSEQTTESFAAYGDAPVRLSSADLIFGDSYENDLGSTLILYNDDDEYILANVACFGFVPAPYLNINTSDIPEIGEDPGVLDSSNWYDEVLWGGDFNGIMLNDGNYYPFYDASAAQAAYTALGGSELFGDNQNISFLGVVTGESFTQSGDQIVIWKDEGEMGAIKALDITGWEEQSDPNDEVS